MGVCGRIARAGAEVGSIDPSLATLTIGNARSQRRWAGDGVRLASSDDGDIASDGADAAVFDGRIDNRAELERALGAGDLGGCGNAQIVLRAFRRWGDDFAERIVGDFACAVWEARRRRIVMVADPCGLRPIYYWQGANELLFASEPRVLTADPDVPREIDEARMGVWLCILPIDLHRTFYRDINRVPPGYSVAWRDGALQTERWWRPENVPELRLPTDRDYEEALRSALDEAVKCRLGDNERVGVLLSGGLDSSAVTALAARALASQGRQLTAFTAVPSHPVSDQPGQFADEWAHAAALVARYPNIEHVRIENDAAPMLDVLQRLEMSFEAPTLAPSHAVVGEAASRAARDRHLTVMLSGTMGNATVSYDGGAMLASQVRRWNVLGAARTALDLRRVARRSWLGLAGEVADVVLPRRLRAALHRAVGKPERELRDFSPIDPAFARSVGVAERAQAMAGDLRNLHRGDSRALRLAILTRLDQNSYAAATQRRRFGIDPRDPTADRRVIELCLSIPEDQFLRDGVYRSLIRRTMRGLVPDSILDEQRRGLQSADWRYAFDAAVPKLGAELGRLRKSPLASRCLDLDRMQALLDRWPGPTEAASMRDYDIVFARGLAAGRFIRRLEGAND